MPDARTSTDAPPPTATVCTCGYDLTGLPAAAAAKCPECGAVIAEIKPVVPRFFHWGRTLAAGMTPSMYFVVAVCFKALYPTSADFQNLARGLSLVGVVFWVMVSFPAFGLIVLRAVRARSWVGRLGAAALGIALSVLANATVVAVAILAAR